MSIAPRCDKCGTELTALGALMFSPPDESGMVMKYHLGVCCFTDVLVFVGQGEVRPTEQRARLDAETIRQALVDVLATEERDGRSFNTLTEDCVIMPRGVLRAARALLSEQETT